MTAEMSRNYIYVNCAIEHSSLEASFRVIASTLSPDFSMNVTSWICLYRFLPTFPDESLTTRVFEKSTLSLSNSCAFFKVANAMLAAHASALVQSGTAATAWKEAIINAAAESLLRICHSQLSVRTNHPVLPDTRKCQSTLNSCKRTGTAGAADVKKRLSNSIAED